jgi:hypothetical protein
MYDLVEKGFPEFRTYGVFYHKGDEDRLSHHHAVWCTNRPTGRIAGMCKEAGKELYIYGNGGQYYRHPGFFRWKFGLSSYVYDAKGTYVWGNFWYKGDLFRPDTVKGNDSLTIRTDPKNKDRPIRTPASKGYREAIDDFRYLRTLELMIAEAEKKPALKAEAAEHKTWLNDWKQKLFSVPAIWQRGGKDAVRAIDKTGFQLTNLEGQTCGVTDKWDFCEFLRKDTISRLLSLKKKM